MASWAWRAAFPKMNSEASKDEVKPEKTMTPLSPEVKLEKPSRPSRSRSERKSNHRRKISRELSRSSARRAEHVVTFCSPTVPASDGAAEVLLSPSSTTLPPLPPVVLDPGLQALHQQIKEHVPLMRHALDVHQASTTPFIGTAVPSLELVSCNTFDAVTILQRQAQVDDLWRTHVAWLKHRRGRSGPHAFGDSADDRERFHTACYDLWLFNLRFIRHVPVAEQIQGYSQLLGYKHAWLTNVHAASPRRLPALGHLLTFFEELVLHAWEYLPDTGRGEDDLIWAQDAVIAWGPDLAYQLYHTTDRPLRRRDFRIGHAYTQGATILQLIEEHIEMDVY
ncbi:MAG: hypothetical protein M1832_001919 [Thelocarpon impressellum]|nr:MAG: hypothetical protein M1832_001919 [Thelocarpon impressellum]